MHFLDCSRKYTQVHTTIHAFSILKRRRNMVGIVLIMKICFIHDKILSIEISFVFFIFLSINVRLSPNVSSIFKFNVFSVNRGNFSSTRLLIFPFTCLVIMFHLQKLFNQFLQNKININYIYLRSLINNLASWFLFSPRDFARQIRSTKKHVFSFPFCQAKEKIKSRVTVNFFSQ